MISPERQQELRGLATPATPEERAWLSAYLQRTGPGRLTDLRPAQAPEGDYEGAILSRQEHSGLYD